MRHFVCFLGLAVLAVPARADVVRIDREGGAEVLYRSGAFIEKGGCEDAATIRRRTTCTLSPQRIEAVSLYDYVLKAVGKDLVEIDAAMGETQANLTETDNKLKEFLASDPQSPDNEQELEAIRAAQGKAAELAVDVEGLEEQIARIKALPDYRTNPDLPRQLATIERQLADAKKARDDQVAEVNALRARYVADRSAGHSQAAFQVLLSQRRNQASQYDSLRNQSQDILDRLVAMNQFIGELVEDQSFAYEIRESVPFARETWQVFGLFAEASKRSGVIRSDMTERGIELVVPHMTGYDEHGQYTDYDSKIQWIRCTFRPFVSSCSYLSTMNLADVSDDGDRARVWDLPLKFDLIKGHARADLQDFERGIFPRDASGNWVFTPACRTTVIDRRNLGQGWCELGFVYVPIRR